MTINAISTTETKITYDYTIYKQPQNKYKLNVYYEIPYSQLFFIKDQGAFISRVRITSEIWQAENFIHGKAIDKTIKFDSFNESKQNKKYSDSITLILPINLMLNSDSCYTAEPAFRKDRNYRVELEIVDLNSTNTEKVNIKFTLPQSISRVKFSKNNVPNPSRTYSSFGKKADTLNAYFEVFDEQVTKCSVAISVLKPKSKNKNQEIRIVGMQIERNRAYGNAYAFNYPIDKITALSSQSTATYILTIIGFDELGARFFQEKDSFYIKNPFFYSDDEYFEMVNQLIYLATDAEMKALKQVSVNARESAWSKFFEKFDPNPATEINEAEQDYFAKIKYCIENFSKGDKGYRSERAAVYMKYGAPDYVESRPFERDSNAYEIWYYYNIGIQFIFIDEHGFGEYTLYSEKRI